MIEESTGSTLMTDVVRYGAPLGPAGTLVDALLLERYMRRPSETRDAWLRHTLERHDT